MHFSTRTSFSLLFALSGSLLATTASAQPPPGNFVPPAPAQAVKPGAPPTAQPLQPLQTAPAAKGTPLAPGAPRSATGKPLQPGATSTTPASDMMTAVPGGITAEQVGDRAAATSYQAKAAEENAQAASARTDAAATNYVPRVQLKGSYTRLSEFKAPSIQGFSFPLVFDQWVAQATIAIPISDYFLKINRAYTASTHQEEAARFDIATARAKSLSDGKIAYFTWLRARGSAVVAEQSLAVARAHQKDSENQFSVGNASKADVLRAQTAVAAAELSVERAKSAIAITERQVRVATHTKDGDKLEPGESLDSSLPASTGNLRDLINQAHAARPEIKSVDKNAAAARKLADVQSANKLPVLSGFGDVTYANPNQRRFPVSATWFPTWAIGAQVTWSPNDFLAAGPGAADADARAAALDAQKSAIRDGIELEVTQAYQSVIEADVAITTTTRQLESAEEAYRVARELFNAGRGTATTLIDAEQALAQTRFDHLNAKVDARLARIRLDHALGRDVKGAP